jgi:DNA polymerase III epsilon subunit-like protein
MSTSIAFDLETTSANNKTTTPVQICLILDTDGERRILMNTLVRPGELISPEASAVHKITNEMVQGAPDYAMVAWQAFLLGQAIAPQFLVGFNSKSFDEPILNRCLGAPVFPAVLAHLDVLDIAYRFFPTLISHKLGALYQEFLGFPLAGAHDASVDVIGTLDLLKAMRVKIGMTIEQLAEDMAVAKPYSIMPIGKHKGKLLTDVDPGWARWMRQNATDMRADLQASVDFILQR